MTHAKRRVLFLALSFALLVPTCLVSAQTSVAATVTTLGPAAGGEGTIGHGSIEPEPAPFDAANTNVQLGSHPAGGFLAGIYTLLAARDVFNTISGAEATLGLHPAPFAGQGTPDAALVALGVTGTVYYSFRGFALDYMSGDDYNYDLGANIEIRTYRGGELEFYFDTGSGLAIFARSTDAVMVISINWNTFGITQTIVSSTQDQSPSLLTIMTGSVGVSSSPVQITGITSEGAPYSGAYGVFNDDGTTWTFEANPNPTPVEASSWGSIKKATDW